MTITDGQQNATTGEVGVPTVASRARDWARNAPNQVAFREKDFGIWNEYTWADSWEMIENAANGLIALGVQPGDRVSIHSEDRLEWIIMDLATVAVRGVTVGFYPTNPTAEVEYLLTDCGSCIHFAEDQEQYDKVLEIGREKLSAIRKIIFAEPRGMVGQDDDRLVFWESFLEMGREYKEAHPGELEARMAAAEDADLMTLVYTSGTTGPPKGAMLTNKNANYCIEKIVKAGGRVVGGLPGPGDEIVTYLPLCHVAERIFSTWTQVGMGPTLNFAESIDTVNENLREIQPTLFFAVPRIWEKLHALTLIKANDATPFKKLFFRFGLSLGRRIGRIKVANGGEHTLLSRVLYSLGWVLVFRPLRERIGLRRCRWAGSGAAAIAPEVLVFFIGIGVPVYELYGMT